MAQNQKELKEQLEVELKELRFTGQDSVLRRTHPQTWRDRLLILWNKELELPLLPLGMTAALLLTLVAVGRMDARDGNTMAVQDRRELVEVAGNIYWKEDYEKAVGLR